MSRVLCVVLLAACAASRRQVTVRFTDEKGKTVREEAYSMDHRMFEVSEYMKKAVEWMERDGKDHIEIRWDPDIFCTAARVLDSQPLDRIGAEDTAEVLYLLDYLDINSDHEAACYTRIARRTLEDYWDTEGTGAGEGWGDTARKTLARCYMYMAEKARRLYGEDAESRRGLGEFVKRILAEFEGKQLRSVRVYALQLLREWASKHGMCVAVDRERATVYTLGCGGTSQKWGSVDTVGVFSGMKILGDRGLGTYRQHIGGLCLLEMVACVMGIPEIDISIAGWKAEDSGVMEEMRARGRLGKVEIECRDSAAGAIHRCFKGLADRVVGLDVSWNGRLNDADWRMIGKMTALVWLKLSFCGMRPGTISSHFQSLRSHLVRLDVYNNNRLSSTDWKAVGEMEALESLVISGCDVSPGTISAHFRSLSKHLKELDVHWNYNLSDTDWRAVGEMEELKSLNMSDCFMVPERISTHLRGLRTHLERLNTSCNANMSGAYWETVGEMAALKSLNMHNCDVATETISAHFRSLKKHLEVLVVSGNKRLGDKDWETIGEMAALKSLDVSFCDMRPSAIGVHIRKLRGGLTSLRVSGNKALSDRDWKTIGKMSALRNLDVSFCEMRPGTIHRHFQELREHLKVLAVSGNKELSYADWETIGKMSVLRKLYVSDCYIQPGTISAQLQGLRKRLEELDVSRNKELSYTDWETIGEMSALRKLDVSECEIEPGTIHGHFQELKSHLVRLYVHDNRKLSDRDWKTVGEMTHLESLWIVGCGVRAGKISKHLRGLRSFQVVE